MREIAKVIKKRHGNVPGKRFLQIYLLLYFGRYLSIRKCEKYLKKMELYARGLNGNHYKGQDTYYHQCKAHPNLVMQDFYLGFREVILLDITYLPFNLGRGMCYHTFFYDPFLDQVPGEVTSETMDVDLIKKAYQRMMEDFGDEIRNEDRVYLHSDNGSQLKKAPFMELTEKGSFERSFSRRAPPGDNRPIEAMNSPIEAMNSRLKLDISTSLLRCKNYEDACEMPTNYHKDRNENRVNLYLGEMTPNQYHEYILTGVYPLGV